jgi:hypothetical protein
MFTDPLAVTYDAESLVLPRISVAPKRTRYRTADGEFEVSISNEPIGKDGRVSRSISLTRTLPDPTPSNAFDAFRAVSNTFGVVYLFDPTRAGMLVDLPLLREALLDLLDSTFQSRIWGGEM